VQQAATDILFRLLDHATEVRRAGGDYTEHDYELGLQVRALVGVRGGPTPSPAARPRLTKDHPVFAPFLSDVKELDALNAYANQCLAGIATAYNSVPLVLNDRFVLNR